MKKWLRGVKSKVDDMADNWINGEENREQEQAMLHARSNKAPCGIY